MIYCYILTIQGSWNREPTYQHTISGVIPLSPVTTRVQTLQYLMEQAVGAWKVRYRGIDSSDFHIVFFSLEKNLLDQ